MENLLKNKKIAIVGGGPAGLILARLLQMKGADVKVYERDLNKDVRVQGATLDLHQESGLEAIRRAGLTDAFYADHRPGAGNLRIINMDLEIKMDTHSETGFEDRPEIDRGPLRAIMLESLEPGTVIWDSQFVAMTKENNLWKLEFKNGTSATADLVIAADGANSKIRPVITSVKPVYSGITVVEGTVYNSEVNAPQLHSLLAGAKIFAFGEEKSLILSSKGDGSMSFYTGCKVDESWLGNCGIDFSNKQQVFEWFKKEFGNWNSAWMELFKSDDLSFVPRPQYHYPLDQSWTALPDLTMLGDAAHRMPPYAGEGVNMAMQDAFELSDCLNSNEFPDLQSAIAAFEKQMCLRASEVTKITLDSTEMLHSENAVGKLIQKFSEFGD